MKTNKKPIITIIGGGTGVFTVLTGLQNYPVELNAIISMADDGGSTGVLREEFGVLPPGDIRRTLVALSHSDKKILSNLFNYRFDHGCLKGHTFGNIMLTALEKITGNFESAIKEAGKILGVKGRVIPVTLNNIKLCAKLEDGSIIHGETNIDVPKHNANLKINEVFLLPKAKINPAAAHAIRASDMIVIGPGDLYTSILPNLIVSDVRSAIKKSKAKKIYIVNVMTKFGETNHFTAADFINTMEKYLGKNVLNYVIINTSKPEKTRLNKYKKESAEFVEVGNLSTKPITIFGDFIRSRGFLRHDPNKLSKILSRLLKK